MIIDLLITNARVHTMDPTRPFAERIGISNAQIVGLDDDLVGVSARQEIDLAGATVLPGFIDAHSHLAWAGLAQRSVDLSGATTIDEALALIEAAALQTDEGGWVDGVGYDQRPFGRHLSRADLDAVSHHRRVYLIHASGHAHLVNSAVIALLDKPAIGAWPTGVQLDDGGRPTGLFLEEATTFVHATRTPYSQAEIVDALAAAGETCAAQGITFVAEAGVGGGISSRSPIEGLAFQQAQQSGRLRLRAQLMISADLITPTAAHPDDDIARAFPLGLRTGFGSARLSIGAVKMWLDGGMMARTAALTRPYLSDDPAAADNHGELAAELETLRSVVHSAHTAGWQLALHAIGDRAVDAAIELIESAQRRHPRPDARHRIEHCGLVRPDQLSGLANAGIVAVIQPSFLHAYGRDYAAIMGPERADWMYRGRSFLDAGITVAGSSDRPVADGAPLRAIQFMVQRLSKEGDSIGAAEAITVEQALQAYTVGAAYACRVEDQLGSIAVGKLADLVVLGADPQLVPDNQLADIPVLATVVGGELIHGRWP